MASRRAHHLVVRRLSGKLRITAFGSGSGLQVLDMCGLLTRDEFAATGGKIMDSESENSHLKIAYSSIRIFANDGQLDLMELNFILGMALRDNNINEDEKRVLSNIFKAALSGEVADVVKSRIAEVRRIHHIP